MDDVFVELMVGEIVQPRQQFELLWRHERQPQPLLGADRAVAGNGLTWIGCRLVTHAPAVATAGSRSPSRPSRVSVLWACPAGAPAPLAPVNHSPAGGTSPRRFGNASSQTSHECLPLGSRQTPRARGGRPRELNHG